jgi:hypothetical protein
MGHLLVIVTSMWTNTTRPPAFFTRRHHTIIDNLLNAGDALLVTNPQTDPKGNHNDRKYHQPFRLRSRRRHNPLRRSIGRPPASRTMDIPIILGIKPATAHFHIERAKKRLGVKTRVEAVAVGVLHGVI